MNHEHLEDEIQNSSIDKEVELDSRPSPDPSEKTTGPREEQLSQEASIIVADVPPDGGYGWVCVLCVGLINAHTWGLNSSYGIFLSHYLTANTYPGASSLEYAFVGGLSISIALLVSPVGTVCIRRFGTRITLLVGVVFQTAALLGASWASEIWQLFLSQGVCFGTGMGFLFVGSVGVVPQWFARRRSFANSLSTAGSGLGGLVYSLATNAMIQSIGLGWAFRVLAIVSCVVNGICAILIRDRNKAVGSVIVAFDAKLLKRPEFLLLLAWAFFSILGYTVLLFSLPNYAKSVGLSAKQASVVGALLNLGQGLGRPFVGYFSDSTGRINIAGVCTFATGLFCLVLWIFAKTYGVLIFFAILVGTVAGTLWTVIGPVGAEVVGLKVLPSALSMTWLVLVIPATFAEPIGLQLRTPTGNYLHAQLFAGFMYIGAAVCMWFLRAWKISEIGKIVVEKEQRAQEIRDDDTVPKEGLGISRHASRTASVKSKAKAAKGLWTLARV